MASFRKRGSKIASSSGRQVCLDIAILDSQPLEQKTSPDVSLMEVRSARPLLLSTEH